GNASSAGLGLKSIADVGGEAGGGREAARLLPLGGRGAPPETCFSERRRPESPGHTTRAPASPPRDCVGCTRDRESFAAGMYDGRRRSNRSRTGRRRCG